VSYENRSESMRAMQILEQGDDHLARPEVQVAGGLVSEQDARVSGQGSSEGDSLLLATRQLSRAM
jgi:hypothetical protein